MHGNRGIMIHKALHPKSWAHDQWKNAQMQTHWYSSTNQRRLFTRLRDGTTGGNNNHQITCTRTLILCKVECSLLMYAEQQALYISSLVRPTFRTYCGGEIRNVSIKHGVRDICHRTVCCCDLQRFQFNDKKDELLGL